MKIQLKNWFLSVFRTIRKVAMYSRNYSDWFEKNTINKPFLDKRIKALKFSKLESQKRYESIQNGLLIFSGFEDEGFQLHGSQLHTQGELPPSFYSLEYLDRLQLEYAALIQYTTDLINIFKTNNNNKKNILSKLQWQLWKIIINVKQQVQVQDKLIATNYFKLSDGQTIQIIEKQRLIIKKQHQQLKSLYGQFIMLFLGVNSN